MSPMKDETKKERKLRKRLEKKQRKLEKRLRTLDKRLRELEQRRQSKRARAMAAANSARMVKPKTAPKTTRKATRHVVAKPKKQTGIAKPKAVPKIARKVTKRAPRKRVPPSPAALVSAIMAVPTQNSAASDDHGAREGDASGVTRKSAPTATP